MNVKKSIMVILFSSGQSCHVHTKFMLASMWRLLRYALLVHGAKLIVRGGRGKGMTETLILSVTIIRNSLAYSSTFRVSHLPFHTLLIFTLIIIVVGGAKRGGKENHCVFSSIYGHNTSFPPSSLPLHVLLLALLFTGKIIIVGEGRRKILMLATK